jgi:hypothetical protein
MNKLPNLWKIAKTMIHYLFIVNITPIHIIMIVLNHIGDDDNVFKMKCQPSPFGPQSKPLSFDHHFTRWQEVLSQNI